MSCKKYAPLLMLVLFGIVACAQEKYGIKNVQLFSRVQMPGNIPVNEKGEPLRGPDTIYSIIVETTGKPVQWKAAYTKNKVYSITATLVSNLPYDAGIDDANGKKILLTPAKGNQLWLLDLSPMETDTAARPTVISPGIMLLQGKKGNTPFSRTIQQKTDIQMMPVY